MRRNKTCATALVAACLYALLQLLPLSPVAAQEGDTVTLPPVEVIEEVEVDEEEEQPYTFALPSAVDSIPVPARAVNGDELTKLKGDEDFWYINEAPKRAAPPKDTSFSLWRAAWFKTLMWILVIGGFIVILIWFLLSSNVQLFRRVPMAIGEPVPEGEAHENIFEIDYDTQIRRAVAAGDLRLAIRLQYLQLLRDLAQKGAIQYSQGLTNSAYVTQVQDKPYGPDFFRITRRFEYAWYGQFPISAERYAAIETEFSNLRSRLSR